MFENEDLFEIIEKLQKIELAINAQHDEEMYQMQALMNQDTTTKPDISKNMNTE